MTLAKGPLLLLKLIAGLHNVAGRLRVSDNRVRLHYQLNPGFYDSIANMDAATLDPVTGELQAVVRPPTVLRAALAKSFTPTAPGYQAMANTVDLSVLAPTGVRP